MNPPRKLGEYFMSGRRGSKVLRWAHAPPPSSNKVCVCAAVLHAVSKWEMGAENASQGAQQATEDFLLHAE